MNLKRRSIILKREGHRRPPDLAMGTVRSRRLGSLFASLILVCFWIGPSHSFFFFCADDVLTWSDLIERLEKQSGDLVLCPPLHITGDLCDGDGSGYVVDGSVAPTIELACGHSDSPDSQCIIDCGGRHFNVKSGAALKVDRMIFRGADLGSIHVEDGGRFTSIETTFENNSNLGSNGGGAIHSEVGSFIFLDLTHFLKNFSQEGGGAIHFNGDAQILRSYFAQNSVTQKSGGAIFAGEDSNTILFSKNGFKANLAKNFGAAIYSAGGWIDDNGNKACNNRATNGEDCDGVHYFKPDTCVPFKKVPDCPTEVPSAMPSSLPTPKPSFSTTTSPKKRPTAPPTKKPN